MRLIKNYIPLKRKILWISILSLIGLCLECKKDPGVGGNGSISGKVMVRKFNATFTTLLGVYPSADQYVYIVYGEHKGYDSRIKTDYNGNFRFAFLYPGKYQIYVYSKDSTGRDLSGLIPVKQDVTLKRKENLLTSDLVVYE